MFQTTRRRLALWYTTVTAILLLLFASGFYLYVRHTLIERIDDTLHHVAEVVVRSLVIRPAGEWTLEVDLEASFRDNADSVEDDHIDLEWFSPRGDLLWSSVEASLPIPLHPQTGSETVHRPQETDPFRQDLLLRQITESVQVAGQPLGYLRVSHPWFEVTKPIRRLILDLGIGLTVMVGSVGTIGWFLSGLAMAPVHASYQRLKQFTADASHELRNPLAMIQTTVQVALTESTPSPHLHRQQLQVIERLTRRLGRLVDDLLFLARQDSEMLPSLYQPCYLDEILLEVVEEQQAIATDQALDLILELPDLEDANTCVQGDRDQLLRLFTNLVSNAIQYTPEQGQVTLQLATTKVHGQSALQVQVKDTGIGIPEDALPHVFERFYRVDPARSHTRTESQSCLLPTGSGLGLAIARTIAENHHGQITVTSTVHQGTTFSVTLPLAPRSLA